jgi:hypothetical protein
MRKAMAAAIRASTVKDGSSAADLQDNLVKKEVAQRGCILVFEVERIHRCLQDLKATSRELEYRLSSETWEKIRELVSEVSESLEKATGRFRYGHQDCSQAVAAEMRNIREQVAGEFAAMAARSQLAQERAARERQQAEAEEEKRQAEELERQSFSSKAKHPETPVTISNGIRIKTLEVARRDDEKLLRLHSMELFNRLCLCRAFHCFKLQAMRQKFDDQLRSLCMTLASNRELLERVAHGSHSQASTAQEFCQVVQKMAIAEAEVEAMAAQTETLKSNRQRLQNWKRAKARQLEHIEKKLKIYVRDGTLDVEGMFQDKHSKKQLADQLEQERAEEDAGVLNSYFKHNANARKLQNVLRKARSKKEEAYENMMARRAEAERPPMSDDERLKLWLERTQLSRSRLAELEEENRELLELGSQLNTELSS